MKAYMFPGYLKVALRNLVRQKGYSFISIGGLSLALASVFVIALYLRDELTYDTFHKNADSIYRIVRQEGDLEPSITQAVPVAPALESEIPQVVHATRIFRYWFSPLVSRGEKGFYEDRFFFTDTAFFNVFSFKLVRGSRNIALADPHSVLLTQSMAHKYFGQEDPMGKTLTLNTGLQFTVTGVLEDPPRTSHFTFDFLAPIRSIPEVMGWPNVLQNWGLGAFPTYVVLPAGVGPQDLQDQLDQFAIRHWGKNTKAHFTLQPLTAIHLHSHYKYEIEPNSNSAYVSLLALIALFILLIAGINYTNLATARFAHRIREVGIRRVVGAHRTQLLVQFLGESVLVAVVSCIVAFALVQIMLPAFNGLVGLKLSFAFTQDWMPVFLVVALALMTGLAAGFYPAFVLSTFRPHAALRGYRRGSGRTRLGASLVVVQYVAAVVLAIGTAAVYEQLHYIQTADLGFARDQVMVLPVRDPEIRKNPERARQAFLQVSSVAAVSASTSQPGSNAPTSSDLDVPSAPRKESSDMYLSWIDDEYAHTLDLAFAAGRNFSPRFPADEKKSLILNETAVRTLGWSDPADAVGKEADIWGEHRQIIGVLKDFHYAPLREPIKPMLFFPQNNETGGFIIRLRGGNLDASVRKLEEVWKRLSPSQPFVYSFLDQDLANQYKAERRWSAVIGAGAVFSLLIASLGLFGLASFSIERRRKELGVRRVLGASMSGLVFHVSGEFIRLVGISILIGAPLAYVAEKAWLRNFAYHIDITWGIYGITAIVVVAVAFLSVSYQSILAARANPVDSLRHE